MNVEQVAKDIKKVHAALTGVTDNDITVTYKGNGYGVVKPWHVRIDSHESDAATYDAAFETLLFSLKQKLQKKADDMARDAEALRVTLNTLVN